ncbi:MAG: single-stranded DNA-binding protein, partial [Pirellulaceae bacterium]
ESDGQKRSKLRVVGERMQLLSGRSAGGGSAEPGVAAAHFAQPANDHEPSSNGPPDDEIPF